MCFVSMSFSSKSSKTFVTFGTVDINYASLEYHSNQSKAIPVCDMKWSTVLLTKYKLWFSLGVIKT